MLTAAPFASLPHAAAPAGTPYESPGAFPSALQPQDGSTWAAVPGVWVLRRSTNGRPRPARLGPDTAQGTRQYLCTDAERAQLRSYLDARRPPLTFDLPVPEVGGAVEVGLAGELRVEPLAGARWLVSFEVRAASRVP